jgi:hypothetical protein
MLEVVNSRRNIVVDEDISFQNTNQIISGGLNNSALTGITWA